MYNNLRADDRIPFWFESSSKMVFNDELEDIHTHIEKRLIELRDKINDSELLDEYTMLYTNMMLSYASTLKINFDNLKE